ncbi:MAG: ATP-grasp domain-containing protein [Thiohalomonadales bacterium]
MKPLALIYIGASQLQLPAIHWAKKMGLEVLVTDSNPDAPGIRFADEYRQLDGSDVDGLLRFAQEITKRHTLVACYCGSDFGLAAVAAISARFRLPAVSEVVTKLALNKAKAKEVLQRAGIGIPQGVCVRSVSELDLVIKSLGLPVIIKPVDSSGSRGVCTVIHRNQLADAFSKAQRYSEQVMVESVIEGDHIDVNGVYIDDYFYPCGLLDRYFSSQPFNYPIWGCQPCCLSEDVRVKVYAAVDAGARALGIHIGPVKADVIVENGSPVILEIGPRFHGDVSTSFVSPLLTNNQSAPQVWFAYLAGKAFKVFLPTENENILAGWMAIFPDSGGYFESIDGIEAASAVDGITQIRTLKNPGYRVDAVADNLAVLGFIWAIASNKILLKQRLDEARQLLIVRMGTKK